MAMVCGLDLHREQITFDALVVESHEIVAADFGIDASEVKAVVAYEWAAAR
jgi:hypothetical protein